MASRDVRDELADVVVALRSLMKRLDGRSRTSHLVELALVTLRLAAKAAPRRRRRRDKVLDVAADHLARAERFGREHPDKIAAEVSRGR